MSSFCSQIHEKPVLILVHGATANGRMWDAVRRDLGDGYRFLTPDLPGHGTRREEPFTLKAAVETVAEAARSVAPARVVVCGDSLGGYVSMASAAALPAGQLRGLVLGGCTLVFEGAPLIPFKIKSVFNKLLVKVLGEKRIVGPRFLKTLVKMGIAEPDARALVDGGVSIDVFGDCVTALSGIDFPALVAASPVPKVFVNGGSDTQMLRHLARYQAAAPTAPHVVFPGARHGVSLIRAREFAAVIEEFVSKLPSQPV